MAKMKELPVDPLQEKIYELIQVDLEKLCREVALQLKLRKDREELVINAEKIMERPIKDDEELVDLVDHCISVSDGEIYDALDAYCPFVFKQYTSDKIWDMLNKVNPDDRMDVSTWAEPRRTIKDSDPIERLKFKSVIVKSLRAESIETVGDLKTALAEWERLVKIMSDTLIIGCAGVKGFVGTIRDRLDGKPDDEQCFH